MLRLLFSNDPEARWQRALVKATVFRHWSAFRRGLSLNALIYAVRTDVSPVKLTKNADVNTATAPGVAVDIANGMRVLVGLGKLRRTIILISNTSAGTRVVTVRKATTSAEIPAADFASIAIPITTGLGILGPFNGQYVQSDGTIWLDFVASHTGNVMPFELPSA
jgi:hypothetical protein